MPDAPVAASVRPAVEGHERSIGEYLSAFGPGPAWSELAAWPPDVFAAANLVLDHTEGYRFVVAPPPSREWPPFQGWETAVREAARAWRERPGSPPGVVAESWQTLTRHRGLPLTAVRTGAVWELNTALLTLLTAADEACAGVAAAPRSTVFDAQAWELLLARGSLARLAPARVRIVPKTHFSERGITIRSLSRYLALCYESVDVKWRSVSARGSARRTHEVLLVPWPLAVRAGDFRPASTVPLGNLDQRRFGFFEFAPEDGFDARSLDAMLREAGRVDAVVFPEAAVEAKAIPVIERTLARHGAAVLVAGVREPPSGAGPGRNFLHFGLRTAAGWDGYEQDKHHRWCLDAGQIRQYRLTRALPPARRWWEAIDIRERVLHVIDLGGGMTAAPLVCEDLARLDEVADLIRRIGPSLVVALLLDGPQLTTRWPARYASVIADDPGSAVLTLTSYGMVARSRPPGRPLSRVVAHWTDRVHGAREIPLAPGSAGILLSLSAADDTLWTADGRRHDCVPGLRLDAVRQLPVRAGQPRTAR